MTCAKGLKLQNIKTERQSFYIYVNITRLKYLMSCFRCQIFIQPSFFMWTHIKGLDCFSLISSVFLYVIRQT